MCADAKTQNVPLQMTVSRHILAPVPSQQSHRWHCIDNKGQSHLHLPTQSLAMTSTHQISCSLALNGKAPLTTVQSQWLEFNSDNGCEVKTSPCIENPKGKAKAGFFGTCASAPRTGWKNADCCKAHVWAAGDSVDVLDIRGLDLVHTCDAGVKHRKRNHPASTIAALSNVLDLCQPASS